MGSCQETQKESPGETLCGVCGGQVAVKLSLDPGGQLHYRTMTMDQTK